MSAQQKCAMSCSAFSRAWSEMTSSCVGSAVDESPMQLLHRMPSISVGSKGGSSVSSASGCSRSVSRPCRRRSCGGAAYWPASAAFSSSAHAHRPCLMTVRTSTRRACMPVGAAHSTGPVVARGQERDGQAVEANRSLQCEQRVCPAEAGVRVLQLRLQRSRADQSTHHAQTCTPAKKSSSWLLRK